MTISLRNLVLPLIAAAALSLPALAGGAMFATEDQASKACGADEVVWVNLDRGRYYHKAQPDYGKSNGAYTCAKSAHAQYREAKESS